MKTHNTQIIEFFTGHSGDIRRHRKYPKWMKFGAERALGRLATLLENLTDFAQTPRALEHLVIRAMLDILKDFPHLIYLVNQENRDKLNKVRNGS